MKAAGPAVAMRERRCAAARLEHLARGERRVALADHAVVVRGVAHAVVQKVALKRFDARARRPS